MHALPGDLLPACLSNRKPMVMFFGSRSRCKASAWISFCIASRDPYTGKVPPQRVGGRRSGIGDIESTEALSTGRSTLGIPYLMEWEHDSDARRLIRGRGVDDRWRHIDWLRVVVATWGLIHTPTLLVPAVLLIPFAPAVVIAERRCDEYTADH